MKIRAATIGDAAAIAGIWNPIIDETTITFTRQSKSIESVRALVEMTNKAGDVFLVLEQDGQVQGFAFTSPFRTGDGYAHVKELSIHLAQVARGRGAGRRLFEVLEMQVRARGGEILVAAISAENLKGIGFHAHLGFIETARMPGLGRKFGRALDLVIMQKRLANARPELDEPV